jgi:hypothetical protein
MDHWQVSLADITGVSYSRWSSSYALHTREGRRLRVSAMLIGIETLLYRLETAGVPFLDEP